MDMNPSRLAKSDHLIILAEDFAQNFETKLFRCSFCKRGFSNAQALGGHMNIHRKDRAKLREFSDENFLSLDMSRSVENDGSHDNDDNDARAENIDYGKGILIPPHQLPLEAALPVTGDGGEHVEVELKYGEVDLELRLGPEPQPHHHAKSKPLD